MGVPKFYRFICERYPCIQELIKESQAHDFDNLYLDMNGIIHSCSHPEDEEAAVDISEEEIFNNIFHYIDVLFYIIKPRKLLFMAVDGVAPRAKLNQQRGRRFRNAKDKELLGKKLRTEGGNFTEVQRFDSNCITPGTEFMVRLQKHLEYFVVNRISNNSLWQSCKVILSGHEVPGEGEHKIVEFIRYMKTLPDYDPYTRHCFYGLDVDLLILGLCTHEHNFSILREEVIYGRKSRRILCPEDKRYCLTHLSLLKEYLDLEFHHLKEKLPFEYDLESIIDDWVLMGFILGNDFIPHLPDFHIAKGALPVLYKTYAEVLPTLSGYLNENGYLNLSRFHTFMEKLAKYERESFEETYSNLVYYEEKLGRKLNAYKDKENEYTSKDTESEIFNIIDDTDSIDDDFADDGDGQESEDETDDDDFAKQFWQHKRDYYTNKLEYMEVTEEVLKSQAEGYVRGLQWILHYYYHGCRSWSWFYPHHYAPCTSDIVNFKDVNLEFELGKPFLPYQQLLAVLPPGSKNLVPKAYQNLMTSPSSPIKDYYPETFETDLNGKQHEWEAVVLLPIINEKDLLDAMEECNANLTPEEKRNNKHGPMLFYSYTDEDLGSYAGPKNFNNIESNHASVKTVWRDEITVKLSELNQIERKFVDPDLYFPGFPTFRYVNFEATKRKGRIRVFNQAARGDSVILTITENETPGIEVLVKELLGKIVYVNWPYLTEARIVAVADKNTKYVISDSGPKKCDVNQEVTKTWCDLCSCLRREYMDKRGIEIGNTQHLIYVNLFKGIQKTFDSNGKLSVVKVWSEAIEPFPLQTVVKDVQIYEPHSIESRTATDTFPVDSVVFMLGYPYYGCKGRIGKRLVAAKHGRLHVKLEILHEPKIDRKQLKQTVTTYYSASKLGQIIGISPVLIARITGNILVDVSPPGEAQGKRELVNIGLLLKFNKSSEEVPGYTKKDTYWKYSKKAVHVLKEYVERYPNVIDYLSSQPRGSCVFPRCDIFPDPNGADEVMEMVKWINNLECSQIPRVPCGSEFLEKSIVLQLEKTIRKSSGKSNFKHLFVKPHLLFKSDLISNSLPPVPTADHKLLDRVISIDPHHTVPLGLRGYIIGIYKGDNQDDMYDILYDEPFPKGMTLNCSPGRGYRMRKASFINISHGERAYQLSVQPKTNNTECCRSVNSTTSHTERPSSAFAHWNSYPSAPVQDKSDQFKTLWSYLEQGKSQDETIVLKKLLKIEDEQKPKDIEDNVKVFFENVSKSAGTMNPKNLSTEMNSLEEIFQKSQPESEKRFYLQLLNYFHSRHSPQPTYQLMELGDKIMCQIILPDGRVYTGLPCKTEDCALESAAMHVLNAVGEIQQNKEQISPKENEKARRIMENQAKLEKGLFKSTEAESSKSRTKSKSNNDKLMKATKSQSQNHRKDNPPQSLPTPPSQWCRQYKSSNIQSDQYKSRNFQNDDSKSGKAHAENLNHYNSRLVYSNNSRNNNWRQDDKTRNHQSESHVGSDFSRSDHSRQKQNQSHSQGVNLRPDTYLFKHGKQDKIATHNAQGGANGTPQKLTSVAAEFIPLQALTRNRYRGIIQTSGHKQPKEAEKVPVPVVTPVKLVTGPSEVKVLPATKQQRKSKIAAKFDADWD